MENSRSIDWPDSGASSFEREATVRFGPLTWTNPRFVGWLPISTAPKDGTSVLLYVPADEFCEACCVVASWTTGGNGWTEDTSGSCSGFEASHWLALPDPPR